MAIKKHNLVRKPAIFATEPIERLYDTNSATKLKCQMLLWTRKSWDSGYLRLLVCVTTAMNYFLVALYLASSTHPVLHQTVVAHLLGCHQHPRPHPPLLGLQNHPTKRRRQCWKLSSHIAEELPVSAHLKGLKRSMVSDKSQSLVSPAQG